MAFWKRNLAALLLLLLAIVLIAAGILTGGAEIVFRKAVNICMECIGLG